MPSAAHLTVYGIATCDTCRKARRWLDSAGMEHRYHDLRADGLDAATVDAWLAELGLEAVLNRRSATWRKLAADTPEDLDNAAARDLILEHPTLVKRPLIDLGDRRLVGFGPGQQQAILDAFTPVLAAKEPQ